MRIDTHTPESATALLVGSTDCPAGRAVHLCNAYTLSLASRDPAYRDLLNRSVLNLADGMPVVWVGRHLGLAMPDRVYGPTLMADTLARGRAVGLRHYLHGGTPEGLVRLERAIIARWPGVQVVGRDAPPFRPMLPWERSETVERIGEAGPHVVWVGLGTPRQDHVVHDLAAALPCTAVAVGAAFDFLAGTKPQAPAWLGSAGLEWAFRLAVEPRRLWRRYLIGNRIFALDIARGSYRRLPPPPADPVPSDGVYLDGVRL